MKDVYENPLNTRYAGHQMKSIFSPDNKFRTWRKLWIALAESQMDLGLPISQEQIDELKSMQDEIHYDVVKQRERAVRHDVMAHVYAYGQQCPSAKGIIHLGATSCYVGDNTDILHMRDALLLVKSRLLRVISALANFAWQHKGLPTLGFTHFQPAQLVTVGKRAALWMQDLMSDVEEIDFVLDSLSLLGCKGTTGTQASFLSLFQGDHEKVEELERLIAQRMGFEKVCPVSGQTYSRKVDSRVMNALASVAQSAHKFSNDIRLLQHLKEVEEPFEVSQIGSSAMAYKRNPMRSERIASLARYVIADMLNPAMTASEQWFERTLDDSANKRISIPEAFLAIDAILILYENVASGLVIYPKVIEKHLAEELPFMATENILMEEVRLNGDRQDLHERIRTHSMAAGAMVKQEGKPNDLLKRIVDDEKFSLDFEDLQDLLDPALYIGRCPEQVEAFIQNHVQPLLDENAEFLSISDEEDIFV